MKKKSIEEIANTSPIQKELLSTVECNRLLKFSDIVGNSLSKYASIRIKVSKKVISRAKVKEQISEKLSKDFRELTESFDKLSDNGELAMEIIN